MPFVQFPNLGELTAGPSGCGPAPDASLGFGAGRIAHPLPDVELKAWQQKGPHQSSQDKVDMLLQHGPGCSLRTSFPASLARGLL